MKLASTTRPRLLTALRRSFITQRSFVQRYRFSNSSIANTPSRDADADMQSSPSHVGEGTAIVTGGSRGIGLAIASQLAQHGISCTLVGRDEKTLQEAVESVSKNTKSNGSAALSPKHQYVVGDVRDETIWSEIFKNSPEARYLINSAGVSHHSFLTRTPPALIRDVLDINLYGTILSCRAALRAWSRDPIRDRCIVNVSSLLAIQGGYGATAYAASKAGVVGLTRAVADEGKSRQIRANVILPGYIESDMTANIIDTVRADLTNRIPLRRFGQPEEVADAALFLIRNKYANNCTLNLDGGLSVAG